MHRSTTPPASRALTTWAIALLTTLCALAQNAPVIEMTSTEYNFGRLKAGAIIHHEFTFTNKGNANLSVTNVLSSCGCLSSTNWSRDIPPGQQGRVPFSFNSSNMSGDFYRTLTISTSDPTRPTIMLSIKGIVEAKIQVTPATAVLQPKPPSLQDATATVVITNHMTEPLNLQAPVCFPEQLRARIETITPGREFKVHIETIPPLPSNTLRGLITIGTTSKEVPVINIPVSAKRSVTPAPDR
jgi:hypothetical protein